MEELRQEQLLKQGEYLSSASKRGVDGTDDEITTGTDIDIKIKSPKIIFDEFLLGDRVLDPYLPALFLLNMGSWEFTNKVYQQNVEHLTEFLVGETPESTGKSQRSPGIYEAIDMKFLKLSMHYARETSQVFLDRKRLKYESFEVFKDMNLGLQMMTLLKHNSSSGQSGESQSNQALMIPDYLINVLFEKLELNFDREIYCQMLKIQAFVTHGSWNDDMKKMMEVMATANDFSQD